MAELEKTYVPSHIEPEVAQRWTDAGAFHAQPTDPGKPYCIVIPPPNVTAALHLGHALNNTLQDILVRWHRMLGDNTLWMPGTDHAGIATQTVVEKRVLAEEGKRRTDFKREDFVAKIQAWKDEYEIRITDQLKAMGCSCDWERQRFTMDPICAKAVREAFFLLFKDGLIYRGKRLVNWDPVTQTALADDEVEMQDIDGHFYYMKYPVVDASGQVAKWPSGQGDHPSTHSATGPLDHSATSPAYITVATTRPETMLGDTAVAMNPKDPRAAALRGKFVRLPIVNRVIPIIEDEYVVLPDPEGDEKARFSTGFLKVTPAHDPNDYELGLKHKLPLINVFSPTATISKDHGWPAHEWEPPRLAGGPQGPASVDPFAHELLNKSREHARKAIVEWFRQNNLLEDVKPYRHSVGHSYRSHVPVEPYLSDQWYVKVTDDKLRGAALRALTPSPSGRGQGEGTQVEEGLTNKSAPTHPQAPSPQPSPKGRGSRNSDWEGQLRFIPERYAKTFEQWHLNIRDWCISRQLWWGHRIPVWEFKHAGFSSEDIQSRQSSEAFCAEQLHKLQSAIATYLDDCGEHGNYAFYPINWSDLTVRVCTRSERTDLAIEAFREFNPSGVHADAQAEFLPLEVPAFENATDSAMALAELVLSFDEHAITQDPDVLDTWFSSALWPISTMGWPDDKAQVETNGLLDAFNPGNALCTAREIITLWVSRMVMFNLYFRECLPFTDVFIHAMIQDGEGRKMSKSLGNGVDPMDIIHSHGSDAMRYTLTSMTTQTQDVRMPVVKDETSGRNTSPKFDLGRNFANKLWNATRFALSNLQAGAALPAVTADSLSFVDRWILSRLAGTIRDTDKALANYEFNVYAQNLYDFIWRDLCDWYIEAVKPTVKSNPAQQRVLATVFDVTLRLLHPVMPYVTEKLWEHLNEIAPDRGVAGLEIPASKLLVRAAWPVADASLIDNRCEQMFDTVRGIISGLREVRTQHKIPPKQKVTWSAKTSSDVAGIIREHQQLIETLANVTTTDVGPDVMRPDDAAGSLVGSTELYLHGLIDADTERQRLNRRVDELRKNVAALTGRLNNKGYTDRAPAHLVQQTRDQLTAAEQELATIEQQLAALK